MKKKKKKYIKKNDTKGKLLVINPKDIASWKFNVPGEHQKENMTCAVEVAKQLKIPVGKIKKSVEGFKGLEGRLQLLKIYKGIKIYNDNNATTPEATIAGIQALSDVGRPNRTSNVRRGLQNKVILICGGADKKLPLGNFIKTVNKNCKAVIFLEGSGTEKLLSSRQKVVGNKVKTIKKAVKIAVQQAQKGDIILFSPAFASFGMFNNEYERNDLFIKIIKGLK